MICPLLGVSEIVVTDQTHDRWLVDTRRHAIRRIAPPGLSNRASTTIASGLIETITSPADCRQNLVETEAQSGVAR